MSRLRKTFKDLMQYPTAVAGLAIIFAFIALAIYTLIAMPYSEVVAKWRGGGDVWRASPRNAQPIWYNWITGQNLPQTIVLNSADETATREVNQRSETTTETVSTFTFEFPYDEFPNSVSAFIDAQFDEKQPLVSFTWIKPNGDEIRLGDVQASGPTTTYVFAQDDRLMRRLRGVEPRFALFAQDPSVETEQMQVENGTYQLRIEALTFEADSDVTAELVVYGQVQGLAGTDHRRRDLMVALLWGTPIALAFGLLAAAGTTITTMLISAIGVWFGGMVDATIQRITEVNLILPLLPILIMVGTFYSRSIWLMLGIVIMFSIFGGAIKTYRALFLQVKESPYIEAARSYGASNFRIIFRYLIPRVIPLLVPQLVTLVPSFVFLEAALAVLGLGDPVMPTWGKVINEAYTNGALFNGYYYWVLEPAVLLMAVGFGFALLGFTLDRIFNPRLRGL